MNRGQVNAVKAANAAQASGASKKKTPSPAGTSGTTTNPPGTTARTPVPDITPERPPHRTAPATTGQPPPAQNYDTVAIPRRAPEPRTDQIPRPPAAPARDPRNETPARDPRSRAATDPDSDRTPGGSDDDKPAWLCQVCVAPSEAGIAGLSGSTLRLTGQLLSGLSGPT